MPTPTSQTYGKERSPRNQGIFHIQVTRIVSLWPRKIFLQWILRKPTASSGYIFDVYRAGSAEGPWNQVASALTDTYYFVDDTFSAPSERTAADLISLRRTLYYKVVVTHATDGSSEAVKPLEAGLDRRRRGMLQKLRRDASVALRKGPGTEFTVFKRRWWGGKCPCRAKSGQTTRSHCLTCYGTGIVNGYWNPVYGFAKRSAAPVNVRIETSGKSETHLINVIMLDVPEVQADDVLVFLRDNKRYLIRQVITTELQTVTVHQELYVSELSRSAVEYDLVADNAHTPPLY